METGVGDEVGVWVGGLGTGGTVVGATVGLGGRVGGVGKASSSAGIVGGGGITAGSTKPIAMLKATIRLITQKRICARRSR
jgi:hypothetical protein